MENTVLNDKIIELENLLNKTINSQYEKETSFGRRTYLDNDLYHLWITKAKVFLSNNFTTSSVIYQEFLKQEKSRNAYDTQKAKLQRLKGVFITAKDELKSGCNINNNQVSKNNNEVFIVHGHDELAKIETARFIEKLKLKPIILHEQVNSGQTIIEKLENYSNVGFGIILYTPCDLGGKDDKELKLNKRARQNVVFEHGFLNAKLGREKVCALIKDDVEIPNDISGLLYISMDLNNAWKFSLAKEMKSSGLDIDMNLVI